MEKGYKCPNCKKFNKYPLYVYAHWYEELTHTCDCGNKVILLEGEIKDTIK